MAKKFKNRFDRMFEGYEHRTFFDSNGRRVTKMVYVGSRYEQALEDRQRIIYKILFGAMFVLGFGLTILSGVFRVPANFATYANIAEAACIILGIFTGVYIFSYLGAVKAMDISTYRKAHGKLILFSLLSAAVSVASAICSLIATLLAQSAGDGLSWLCIGLQLLSAVCYGVIWHLERKTEYIITEGDQY